MEVGVFQRGWVALSENLRGKGSSPANHCWCQKAGVIALLCGIKTPAMHCLVLSQCTRVTDRRTDGQNYDFQDCASIAAGAVKTGNSRHILQYCAHNISTIIRYDERS